MIKIKHLRDLRLPVRASAYYTAAAVISKGVGLAFTPVFTRITSTEEYGTYTLYLSVLGISTVLVTSLASGSAIYKGYRVFRGCEDEMAAGSFGLSVLVIPIISVGVILFGGVIGLSPYLVAPLALQLLCDAAIAVRCTEYRYSYTYGGLTRLTVLSAILTPLLSLLLIRAMGGSVGRIYGMLLVSVALALPTLVRLLRVGPYSERIWRYMAKNSLPLLPLALASAVISQGDKLILAAYMGSGALASYAVAHSIGVGLTFITGSLGAALQPWMMRRLEGGDRDGIARTVSDVTVGLSALGVFVVALAPEALALLTPRAYSVALPAIFPTTMSVLPNFILSVLAVVSIHIGKPHYASISSAVGAVTNVLANLILIPALSYFGAGVSLFLAYALANATCFRLLREREEVRFLYRFKLIGTFAFTSLLSAVMTLLYDNLVARLALLTIPALLLLSVWRSAREYIGER